MAERYPETEEFVEDETWIRLVAGSGQVESVVADAAGQAMGRGEGDPQPQGDRVAVVFDQLATFGARSHEYP
jgi:hypothetical protein